MSCIKCPYCFCLFFSRSDLNNHLRVFGLKAGFHVKEFEKVHNAVKRELSRLHGGADRAVYALRRIVFEDYEMVYYSLILARGEHRKNEERKRAIGI
jgi:hypothetical protein